MARSRGAGALAGRPLTPERVLKDLIACSRETLRAALTALDAEGEIWRHVGQGTFRGRAPLGRPVKDTLLLAATTPTELMEARRLLEPQPAAAAAVRRVDEDLALLRRRVEEGRPVRDGAACERADHAFHQTIAQARNPLLGCARKGLCSGRAESIHDALSERETRRRRCAGCREPGRSIMAGQAID